ncbi:MAG: YraN family protein [Thermodesulfobacteriota bacterium]
MSKQRQRYGRFGETLAADALVKMGYRIIETNYRNRFGEIDIIATEADTLVFVEVRARHSDRFGSAAASVNSAKQRQISKVALGYLKAAGKMHQKSRFDVVAVSSQADSPRVDVIRNAFEIAYG